MRNYSTKAASLANYESCELLSDEYVRRFKNSIQFGLTSNTLEIAKAKVAANEARYKILATTSKSQPPARRERKVTVKPAKKLADENEKIRKFVPAYSFRKHRLKEETASAAQVAVWSAWGEHDDGYSYIDFFNHLPTHTPYHTKDNHLFKLPEWRDLSPEFSACLFELELYQLQLESPGYVSVPFVFNLSASLAKTAQEAYHSKNIPEITYYERRIKKALKRALNRSPEMWLNLEMADNGQTGKPHLHGTMLVKPSELRPIRKALHSINGTVSSGFKIHAARFLSNRRKVLIRERGLLSALTGWGRYSTKEISRTQNKYLDRKPGTKKQETLSVSRSLNQRTKSNYQLYRSPDNATVSKKPLWNSW